MEEEEIEIRTCGRPNKNKTPCKMRLGSGELACRKHATPEELKAAENYWVGWQAGHKEGVKHGRMMQESDARKLVREAEEQAKFRMKDSAGKQIVQVDGYAYTWNGDELLVVGDRVLLPPNWLSPMKFGPGPFEGTVTKLGTTYDGTLSVIIRKV